MKNVTYPTISKQILVNIGHLPAGYYCASFAFNALKAQGFKVKKRLFNGFLLEKATEHGNTVQAEIKHVPQKYWHNNALA
jgi:hypothetical protein